MSQFHALLLYLTLIERNICCICYSNSTSKNSLNLIKELRSYQWQQDKDGNILPKPIDFNNHAIDAMRYACLNSLTQNAGEYYIL